MAPGHNTSLREDYLKEEEAEKLAQKKPIAASSIFPLWKMQDQFSLPLQSMGKIDRKPTMLKVHLINGATTLLK